MNNSSFAVQAVAKGPMTVAPPSFDGHGWLVVINLAGFTSGFIISLMLALKMARDIWLNRACDKFYHPVTVWRAFGGTVSLAMSVRFGPAAMVLWGWDPTRPSSTAWLLTLQRLTDPVAFTLGLLALAMFEISGKGMANHLKRRPLPMRLWASREQLKRPACIVLLSLIAAIGVVSTR
jgi:hypothetical protein